MENLLRFSYCSNRSGHPVQTGQQVLKTLFGNAPEMPWMAFSDAIWGVTFTGNCTFTVQAPKRTACISTWLHDVCSHPEVNLATMEDPSLLCSHAAMVWFFHPRMKTSDWIGGRVLDLACNILSPCRGYLCNVNQSLLSCWICWRTVSGSQLWSTHSILRFCAVVDMATILVD